MSLGESLRLLTLFAFHFGLLYYFLYCGHQAAAIIVEMSVAD
jgi:hypothetical protein